MATDFAFLHGGGQGSWIWDETIAAVRVQAQGVPEREVRCLALDAPGCGMKRDRDRSVPTFDDTALELIADIENAGLSDTILVGHSQAGKVMPRMVELRGDLFSRLIYVSCNAATPGLTTAEMMGEGLHGESETQIGWPVDPKTTTMEQRFRAMFCNDMSDEQADAFLGKMGKDMWPDSNYAYSDWRYDHLAPYPSTFVHCLRDNALPPNWQDLFAKRFHADRIVYIDAGHQVMNTRPHALAEVLLAEACA